MRSAVSKVAEKLNRMENNQEDMIDELPTMLNADGTDESIVVSDTSAGHQDSQNSLLEGLIKLFSSQAASSSVD